MKITPYLQYKTEKELPENYWKEKQKKENYAYVWQFPYTQEAYTSYHKVDFDGETLNEISSSGFTPFELVKINLFPFPNNIDNLNIRNTHLKEFDELRKLLNKYFYDVLASNRIEKNRGLDFDDYNVLIMPKETVDQIEKTINEYNIAEVNDFVFYLIAKIQKIYVEEIQYYQKKEQQTELKKFQKECENFVKVIDFADEERTVITRWDEKNKKTIYGHFEKQNKIFTECEKPLKLKRVTFHFDNDDNKNPKKATININNNLLHSQITGGMVHVGDKVVHHTEEEKYLDWKKYMQNLHSQIYSKQQEKNQFKHNIAKALYRFLMEELKLNSEKSLEVIVHILKFSLIEIKQREFEDLPADKEVVRKWIER